ncbi:hypothetical protein GN956_G22793 [Arapaima gigas]
MGQTSSKPEQLRPRKVSPLSADLFNTPEKQKRGGKVVQAFRWAMPLLNSCRRKTKVKQFKTPVTDQDLESSGHASFSTTGLGAIEEAASGSCLETWSKKKFSEPQAYNLPGDEGVPSLNDSETEKVQALSPTEANPLAPLYNERDVTCGQAAGSADVPTVDPDYEERGAERSRSCCEEQDSSRRAETEMQTPQASVAKNHKGLHDRKVLYDKESGQELIMSLRILVFSQIEDTRCDAYCSLHLVNMLYVYCTSVVRMVIL